MAYWDSGITTLSFKPYYNWITFNTNLYENDEEYQECFKPYYNWITFNTL